MLQCTAAYRRRDEAAHDGTDCRGQARGDDQPRRFEAGAGIAARTEQSRRRADAAAAALRTLRPLAGRAGTQSRSARRHVYPRPEVIAVGQLAEEAKRTATVREAAEIEEFQREIGEVPSDEGLREAVETACIRRTLTQCLAEIAHADRWLDILAGEDCGEDAGNPDHWGWCRGPTRGNCMA